MSATPFAPGAPAAASRTIRVDRRARTVLTLAIVAWSAACTTGQPIGPDAASAPHGNSSVPAALSITPPSATVKIGGTITLAAVVTNSAGQPIAGQTVTWQSTAKSIASVSTGGTIAGVATGTTSIVATVDGITASTTIAVVPNATASAALSTPAQVIKGWGLYPTGESGLYNRKAMRDAVYATGLTFIRVQADPALYDGGSTLSDIAIDPTTLTVLEQVLAEASSYGVNSYIMSVWSPPAAMKTNNSVLGSSNGSVGSLKTTSEAAFVAYLTKVMLTLQADGMPLPSALSIQNEPESASPWGGCVYTPAQWVRVIKAVRASFDANGLSGVVLFGPETGQYTSVLYADPTTHSPGYFGGPGFPAITGDAALAHAVGAYAVHTYGECEIAGLNAGIQAAPRDVWMTEFSQPTGTTETEWTLDMLRALGAHLTLVPQNYWAWWNGWALATTPDNQSLLAGDQTPVYSKRYWALKQLWTTVRPGWRVTHMTTTDATLNVTLGSQNPCTARIDLTAFVSPDGTSAAVLMVNPTTTAKLLAVSGLPGSAAQPYRSDANADMAAQPLVAITGGVADVPLPPMSAVLVVTH